MRAKAATPRKPKATAVEFVRGREPGGNLVGALARLLVQLARAETNKAADIEAESTAKGQP